MVAMCRDALSNCKGIWLALTHKLDYSHVQCKSIFFMRKNLDEIKMLNSQ